MVELARTDVKRAEEEQCAAKAAAGVKETFGKKGPKAHHVLVRDLQQQSQKAYHGPVGDLQGEEDSSGGLVAKSRASPKVKLHRE